jgi:hypothetical protein
MGYYSIDVTGATSLSGTRMVLVNEGSVSVWIRQSEFSEPRTAFAKLNDAGLGCRAKANQDKLLQKVDDLTSFPPAALVDQTGWIGGYFALPDGTVFAPKKAPPATVVFRKAPEKFQVSGTFEAWTEGVATPLIGQTLPAFVIMMAFMPPLLKLSERNDNYGFEMVGQGGTGKSTSSLLGASVLGSADFVTSFYTTLGALEAQIPLHADLPLLLEEANLYMAGETTAKRGAAFKAFAFMMSMGREKDRYNAPAGSSYRFSYLSTSNEPLASLIGEDTDVARAAGDRLITLEIPDRTYGVFDSLPPGVNSASEFAGQLRRAAAENHGHAIRIFLGRLVRDRGSDETALRADIRRWMDDFRQKCGADPNNGSEVRVADSFGLVYAAGRLAKRYKALPEGWKCLLPVLTCYRTMRRVSAPPKTFEQRLTELAGLPDTVDLDAEGVTRKMIAAGGIFVRNAKTCTELIIRPNAMGRALPNWSHLRRQPEVKARILGDQGRHDTKRKLGRKGSPERVYCFKLADREPDDDADDVDLA